MKNRGHLTNKAVWIIAFLVGITPSTTFAGTVFNVPNDKPNIQAAIIDAQDGDTIIIEPGTYTGFFNQDINFQNKAITVRSTDPNDPNVVMATIIDADGSDGDEHRGFIFDSGEGASSILDGVTIINGYSASGGGGIRCINSSPTIRNCIIKNNTANGNGGGIYLETSTSQILNCQIYGNMTLLDGDGGGISCLDGNNSITHCQIYDNFADGAQSQGGGVYCDNNTLDIRQSQIYGNRSVFGGGIFCFNSSILTVSHSIISGNSAEGHGGGIYNLNSTVELEHCSLSENRAFSGFGGALRGFSQGETTLTNSILWGNHAELPGDGTGNEIILTPTNSEEIELTVGYCNIQGGLDNVINEMADGDVLLDWQMGNINIEPLFVEQGSIDDSNTPGNLDDDVWNEGDYHLQVASLCIDRGDPNGDFENEPLPNGDRVNLGAFGNTSEAALSIRSPITLTKGSVKGDKKRLEPDKPLLDSIKLKGNLYGSLEDADVEDFIGAETITVRIDLVDSNDLPTTNILLDTFDIEYDPNKVAAKLKFSYKRPKENNGDIQKLKISYKNNTFSLSAKKIDLTGLSLPFKIEIAFGDYLGDIVIHNIAELGSKKELPLCLLLGASDELEVTKAKVKTTTAGDSLTAKGFVTSELGLQGPPMTYLDLTQEELTIRWGGDEIDTLIVGSFEEISLGRFRYPKSKTDPTGITRKLEIDFNKCRFKLSVKEADPLASTDDVVLEFLTTSGNFSASGIAEFPPAVPE